MDFKIIKRERFHVVGVPQSSDAEGCFGDCWQQFELIKETISKRADASVAYGLEVYPPEGTRTDRFTYFACCEVSDLEEIPVGMFGATVPAAEYAVFAVKNWHVTLGDSWARAYEEVLPKSEYRPYMPWDFEYYDERASVDDEAKQEIDIYIPVLRR